MLEKDAITVTDILVQVAAVNAALNSFNRELLANHICRPVWPRMSGPANDQVLDSGTGEVCLPEADEVTGR